MDNDAVVGVHGGLPQLVGVHLAQAFVAVDLRAGHFGAQHLHFFVVVGVLDGLTLLQLEQRRLGDIDIAVVDQRAHIAEEEGQHQCADVRTVDISIGHDEDLVVAHFADIKLVANTGAQRGDNRHQFIVAVDAVGACFFDIQHLAPQRQDGLNVGVSAHLGRAACRIALHDEEFCLGGVFFVAVSQLAGHTVGFQRTLAADQLAGLFGGGAGAGSLGGLLQNCLGNGGVFLKELCQRLVDDVVDQALDEGVAQLCLGLALELGLLQLDADDGDDALAGVGAGQVLVLILQNPLGAAVLVQHAGQGQLEAFLVGAALGGMDVVGKAQQQFVIAVVVVLQGDLGHSALALALHIHDLGVQRR